MSEAVAADPRPNKPGRKFILLAALGLLLAGGGAGGAWLVLGRAPAGPAVEHVVKAAPKKAESKPLFTTLELFTVNLRDPRGERFAQVGITLQFDDASVEAAIKDRLPAVRNDILLLISSKQVEDLLTVEGKRQLAEQVRFRAGRALGLDLPEPGTAAAAAPNVLENPVRAVLFSQFIVQ